MSKVALSGNASGTGIFTIASPNGDTDRTLTLPDNTGTILTTATPGVPVNGPLFYATQSTAVVPASNTTTKITINTIAYDTNSNFSTANNRFTPTVAGYYQFNGSVLAQGTTNTSLSDIVIFKNGGAGLQGTLFYNAAASYTTMHVTVSGILYMNGSTDYVELYGRVIGAGTLQLVNGVFSGALIRSAT
jgi:hypothetical protein